MWFERWGALSVADHVDTHALVANVLLYDRLIVPTIAEQDNRAERAYWAEQNWNPDLQAKRVAQLGDLAIPRPWDAERRAKFTSQMRELTAHPLRPVMVDAQGMTRRILAHEHVVERPAGVTHVQVIAAYNTADGLLRDFRVESRADHLETQAFLLSRRLAVPAIDDPEDSLKVAIDLSRDDEFREHRAALFDWQERMVAQGIPPHEVVEALAVMTEKYNAKVRQASRKVLLKLAFTFFGVGAAFATGEVVGAGVGAALALVQFLTLESTPAVEAGSARPAAMFHDIEARLGLPLRASG